MNNPRPQVTGTSRGRIRRHAHLTAGDVEILEALTPEAARAFENELLAQHRSNRRQREHAPPIASPRGDDAARWSHGCGGGRRRPRHPGADDGR